ncbi:protein-glutamate O-methyltransferase CheR [Cytophagaceae bacterium ABcell3]|nr:protein-glutamate O-methyltransferase CheR [Cytophagaceae bacterium ABcell3]
MTFDEKLEDLIQKVHQKYGYDFSGYTRSSFSRRVSRFYLRKNYKDIDELAQDILYDEKEFTYFLQEITVNVTEMFRDPSFFLSLRKNVFPLLSTYPYIKIWDAGCSTGEELFSLAIMLKEENLLHKTKIYATDINPKVLQTAKEGIYPVSMIKDTTKNYYESGGKESFSKYYISNYGSIKFDSELLENVIFYPHNLATDSSFNEFQLIICRNVLIYFNKVLQDRVFKLFSDSLVDLGYLGLGLKETLYLSPVQKSFEVIDKENKIYRKNITK